MTAMINPPCLLQKNSFEGSSCNSSIALVQYQWAAGLLWQLLLSTVPTDYTSCSADRMADFKRTLPAALCVQLMSGWRL